MFKYTVGDPYKLKIIATSLWDKNIIGSNLISMQHYIEHMVK